MQKQLKEKDLTIKALEKEREAAREATREFQNRLRDLDLQNVADRLGLVQVEKSETWKNAEKTIKIKGPKWFDDNAEKPAKGANSIDLVAHILDCKPNAAIGWLRDNYGSDEIISPLVIHTEEAAKDQIKNAPSPPPFTAPERNDALWPKVRHYLTVLRKIAEWIVDGLHKMGTLYADTRGNAVFVYKDKEGKPIGAELRGTDANSSFKGLTAGSTRKFGAYKFKYTFKSKDIDAAKRPVVFVESAIDALSYAELHPDVGDGR
jgi:hypothetical protein